MKLPFLLLLCISLSREGIAQYFFLQLKNGIRIEIASIQDSYNDMIKYKTPGDKKDTKISKLEVDFYSIDTEKWFLKCPSDNISECHFAQSLVNGKIEVFGNKNQYTYPLGSYVDKELFVNKKGESSWSSIQNTTKVSTSDQENLQGLISDDKYILEKYSQKRNSYEDLLQLVREYNQRHHSEEDITRNIEGKVVVYLKSKKPIEKPLRILVNDTDQYLLPYGTLINIELKGDPCKICIEEACGLLSPSFRTPYIEVSIDKKTLKTKLTQVDPAKAVSYIKYLKEK